MEIKSAIKSHYLNVAKNRSSCCADGCDVSLSVGYDQVELAHLPGQADLGLGCGNPVSEAALRPGEKVLDLGCGAGIDVFLAARLVGENGHVYGLDMTEGMLELARANAREAGIDNVTFTQGEIEHIPMGEHTVDVILSNCVINLSQDKRQVFDEIYRVLVPGGRLCISDTLLLDSLPQEVRDDPLMHSC